MSESAARRYWPEGDAVGRRFVRGDPGPQGDLFEIIGVVPDVHSADLTTEPKPLVYVPLTTELRRGVATESIAVRTEGDPARAGELVRRTVASLDGELRPVEDSNDVGSGGGIARPTAISAGSRRGIGPASLLIAALGTYSVVADDVARRAHEFRCDGARRRCATGRSRRAQARHAAGISRRARRRGHRAAARPVSHESVVRRVARRSSDVGLRLRSTLVAALFASWLPARRAARASPVEALRYS